MNMNKIAIGGVRGLLSHGLLSPGLLNPGLLILGLFCFFAVATTPAQAQNQQGELSATQAWIEGIEDPSLGYRSWIHGIVPVATLGQRNRD